MLVVGAGNSGIDLAGLLVRVGANVTVSMRTPPNVFPRDWLGVPLGLCVLIAEHLPSRPVDALGRFIQWQVYGNLSSYGLRPAPEGFMTRFPRYADGVPADPETPGLYSAGFRVALSGSIRVAGQHARRIATAIARETPAR
jgi:cation diffusion facilitator CzcD-associated flavoprotein CzcO